MWTGIYFGMARQMYNIPSSNSVLSLCLSIKDNGAVNHPRADRSLRFEISVWQACLQWGGGGGWWGHSGDVISATDTIIFRKCVLWSRASMLYHCNTTKDESTKYLIRVQCVVYTRSMERDGDTVVRDCHTGAGGLCCFWWHLWNY